MLLIHITHIQISIHTYIEAKRCFDMYIYIYIYEIQHQSIHNTIVLIFSFSFALKRIVSCYITFS